MTAAGRSLSLSQSATSNALARLRRSEERYRSLLESLDEGFCVIEMLFDDVGKPIDYRFLEANPTFARFTGLEDAVGKTARQLVPNLEAHWFEIYGNVALKGEPYRFIEGSEAMGRWFDVYAFRPEGLEPDQVALLFTDITSRRNAEEQAAAQLEPGDDGGDAGRPARLLVAAGIGAAAGVGCSYALMGDLVVAAESAYFLQAFRRIGLVPDGGATWMLPKLVGKARAMELMLLGEKLPARTALDWGLINRCVSDDEVMPAAMASCDRIREPSAG